MESRLRKASFRALLFMLVVLSLATFTGCTLSSGMKTGDLTFSENQTVLAPEEIPHPALVNLAADIGALDAVPCIEVDGEETKAAISFVGIPREVIVANPKLDVYLLNTVNVKAPNFSLKSCSSSEYVYTRVKKWPNLVDLEGTLQVVSASCVIFQNEFGEKLSLRNGVSDLSGEDGAKVSITVEVASTEERDPNCGSGAQSARPTKIVIH